MNEEPRIEPVELLKPELPKPEIPQRALFPSSSVFAKMQSGGQLTEAEINNLRRWHKEGVFNAEETALLIENGIINDPELEKIKHSFLQRIPEYGTQIIGVLLMKNAKTTLAGLVTAIPVLIMGISALISGDTNTGIKNILEALGIILVGFFAKDAASTSTPTPAP